MPIIISSILTTAVGAAVVYLTSPTLASVINGSELTWVTYHSLFIDALFAFLIGFFMLCYLEAKWIATNQSFPYTFHVKNNVGVAAFDFQLLVFELYHTNKLNRYAHIVCLFLEEFFWLYIIRITFGFSGLVLCNIATVMQSFTFKDYRLAFMIAVGNIGYSALGMWTFDRFAPIPAVDACKIALFWVVMVRTAVHAAEPLPPAYDSETNTFEESWTEDGYLLIPRAPLKALWLFTLGLVSELGAGVPGRLFGAALYKVVYRLGYRSKTLRGVDEARDEALYTLANGWASNEVLAPYFNLSLSIADEKQSIMV